MATLFKGSIYYNVMVAAVATIQKLIIQIDATVLNQRQHLLSNASDS